MKLRLLAIAICIAGLVGTALAQTGITQIMGGAIDAKIPTCEIFQFTEESVVTFPTSTLQAPFSLSINRERNLWTASVNINGGNIDNVYTGTLTPLAIVGTSVNINSGGIVGFTRAVIDGTNGYVINAGNAGSTCGADCYQYRTVDANANLGAAVNTLVTASTIALGGEGITQSDTEVFISAAFGATAAGNAVARFVKGVGVMTFVNGTENIPGSNNGPVIFDSANSSLYASHGIVGGTNQFARYNSSPLAFNTYVTTTAEQPRGGFAINTIDNDLLMIAGLGGAVTAYSFQLPALTAITSIVIDAAGSGPTQNVAYSSVENKMFLMTQARNLIVKNPITLATLNTYADTTALTIFSSVMNGLGIDDVNKRLYYFRENAGSSLQLVKLKYCA